MSYNQLRDRLRLTDDYATDYDPRSRSFYSKKSQSRRGISEFVGRHQHAAMPRPVVKNHYFQIHRRAVKIKMIASTFEESILELGGQHARCGDDGATPLVDHDGLVVDREDVGGGARRVVCQRRKIKVGDDTP